MVGRTEASLHPVHVGYMTDRSLLRLLEVLLDEVAMRANVQSLTRVDARRLRDAIRAEQLSTDHSGDTLVICRAIIPERVNV